MNAALLLAAIGALSLLVSWPLAAQGDGFGCSLGEDERELKFDTNTDIKTFPASAFNRNKHYHIILDAEATEVVIELQTFSKDILIETTSNAKIGRIVFPELTEADELIFELSNSKQATTIEFPKLKDVILHGREQYLHALVFAQLLGEAYGHEFALVVPMRVGRQPRRREDAARIGLGWFVCALGAAAHLF